MNQAIKSMFVLYNALFNLIMEGITDVSLIKLIQVRLFNKYFCKYLVIFICKTSTFYDSLINYMIDSKHFDIDIIKLLNNTNVSLDEIQIIIKKLFDQQFFIDIFKQNINKFKIFIKISPMNLRSLIISGVIFVKIASFHVIGVVRKKE